MEFGRKIEPKEIGKNSFNSPEVGMVRALLAIAQEYPTALDAAIRVMVIANTNAYTI